MQLNHESAKSRARSARHSDWAADTIAGLCSRGFTGGPQSRGPGAAVWSGITSPSWRRTALRMTVCDQVSDVTQGPPWWCKRLSALRFCHAEAFVSLRNSGPSCMIRVPASFMTGPRRSVRSPDSLCRALPTRPEAISPWIGGGSRGRQVETWTPGRHYPPSGAWPPRWRL